MTSEFDRRSALRAMAVLAGTAAAAPLLGESALAQTGPGGDADALFKAGKFDQAGRAYEEILKTDPGNVRAARQRGYVGLLSNNFPDAEKYLTAAIALAPQDKDANRLLADCYIRQDKFALAAPRWQAAGHETTAKLFAAFRGQPYQIHGDSARVPWRQLDPVPLVEASINGGPPKKLSFYTRVGPLNLSEKAAGEAGLQAVAKEQLEFEGKLVWSYYGVLDSFRLGDLELRNIPVRWSDGEARTGADGLIGTWILYHFLTTIDYAGRSLILRRRTPDTARQARAAAERAGAEPLPLWLAREHLLFSKGSVTDSGARVAGLNIGGTGEMLAGMTQETAKQLRVRTDHDRPLETSAGGQFLTTYPCYPKEVRLGNAVARDSYCYANDQPALGREGFDVLVHFSHSFYKPYNITLDFTAMTIHIARGPAT
ncbi:MULTISPECIES: tetratricopeptide repeat protein [unclassified Crossiella]|uniref:tetratricopeptide repeat protein n=1 Tax=unclassified Crossiella TaxID=2620835 RepID=UPI001FFFFF54|nr:MULTISPECIES: tetratricopeptide repeat protein [unclassified Crossiella]MCK2239502.1 tetratricopeptide repeat protein [Crossiella sp. S99.2]MCK2252197.1 tetratricopeptide repeat protein [Crossiella sp. S99.1]